MKKNEFNAFDKKRIELALENVMSHSGENACIDDITMNDINPEEFVNDLHHKLVMGTYRHSPKLSFTFPINGGGKRYIYISTLLEDRVVQVLITMYLVSINV